MDNCIETDYTTDVRLSRRKGVRGTNEFFTPTTLVNKMLDKISPEYFTDFTKTILEPSAGNGNFLMEIYSRRLNNCNSYSDIINAISTIYAVELMDDNVKEIKERIYALIESFNCKITEEIKTIIDTNIVCSDFFNWNYEKWESNDKVNSMPLF